MLKTLPYEGRVSEPHVWVAAATKPGQQGGQEGGAKESPHDADTAGLSPLNTLPPLLPANRGHVYDNISGPSLVVAPFVSASTRGCDENASTVQNNGRLAIVQRGGIIKYSCSGAHEHQVSQFKGIAGTVLVPFPVIAHLGSESHSLCSTLVHHISLTGSS
jgi:hypothetical protein